MGGRAVAHACLCNDALTARVRAEAGGHGEHAMPGMGTFLQTKNPVVVSAFHTALLHQILLIGLVLVFLSLVWNILRTTQYRRSVAAGAIPAGRPGDRWRRRARRPAGASDRVRAAVDPRRTAAAPIGDAARACRPVCCNRRRARRRDGSSMSCTSASGSGPTTPCRPPASAVWLQLGIGALLLLAPRGRWSRFAGLAATGWGLVVWVFGEAFGGIFGTGASWLFGTPGAVLFYCVAGALVALPDRAWSSPRLGRLILRGSGVFLLGMAVLQAWPGRGFWQGSVRGTSTGTLTAMVRQMAQTPQPGPVASVVRAFGRFDASHGWGVNLFVVILLAAIGIAFCIGRPPTGLAGHCARPWRCARRTGSSSRTSDSSEGSEPIPTAWCRWRSCSSRVTWPSSSSGSDVPPDAPSRRSRRLRSARTPSAPVGTRPWWDRVAPGYLARVLAAVAAIAVVLVGAVPMAAASVNPNADPILAVAVDGTPNIVDVPAPGFRLVDQAGRTGVAVEPPGPDGGADIPRPRVHVGLPTDRPGIP